VPATTGGLFCSAPAPAPLGGLFGGAPAPAFGGQAPAPAIGAPAAPAGPISTKQRTRKKKSKASKSAQRKKQQMNKKARPALVVNNDVELLAPVQGDALPATTVERALPVESSTVELYDVLDHLLIMADKQDTVKDIVLSVAIHFDLLKVEKSMKELSDLIQGYVSATFKVS
jgi:hypothetical protein